MRFNFVTYTGLLSCVFYLLNRIPLASAVIGRLKLPDEIRCRLANWLEKLTRYRASIVLPPRRKSCGKRQGKLSRQRSRQIINCGGVVTFSLETIFELSESMLMLTVFASLTQVRGLALVSCATSKRDVWTFTHRSTRSSSKRTQPETSETRADVRVGSKKVGQELLLAETPSRVGSKLASTVKYTFDES